MSEQFSRRDLLKWFSAGAGAATIGSGAHLY
jgi:TAT (twin-arginine translocation) pathway signal sequence